MQPVNRNGMPVAVCSIVGCGEAQLVGSKVFEKISITLSNSACNPVTEITAGPTLHAALVAPTPAHTHP